MNPLKTLETYNQSIWLDYIRRNLLSGGELQRLIDNDGIKGVTSNPAIFEKAIAGSTDYTQAIAELTKAQLTNKHSSKNSKLDSKAIFEQLAVADIQNAADLLKPIFIATAAHDGYVSMEVSPRLAHDTAATIHEAKRLWQAVNRPNLMIKVPATPAGLPAIESLLAEGINVNVTLLFAVPVYEQVVESHLRGLERAVENGHDIAKIASVASFFVSRVDSALDILLDQIKETHSEPKILAQVELVQGRVAVANAKLAYQRYKVLYSGVRWESLKGRGAQSQRLLWASTGTKNPSYSDVLYINELIGPDTVNTIPPATLDAFRDHGHCRASLEENMEEAFSVLETVAQLDIELPEVTARLLSEGLDLFVTAFDKVLDAVEVASRAHSEIPPGKQYVSLPSELQTKVNMVLDEWQKNKKLQRLWARDAWLWTGKDESQWLDWLDVTCEQQDHLGDLRRLVQFAEGKYYKHAVLLGMGGSSLAPDVLRNTFGVQEDYPDWIILDSTDPAQVKAVEDQIDYKHTLFLVSSKSGSTLEPNILKAYFFNRATQELGKKQCAYHFGAVTDPGSNLEKIAKAEGFRGIFYGKSSIGGRYSALSNFGMVPAAAMGLDVSRILERTEEMIAACAACVPVHENPGVVLGIILGVAATMGRDKLTLVASPGIATLGGWLEQLVAESSGKQGHGIIPVDGEELGSPSVYGADRIFVYLRLIDHIDSVQEKGVAALAAAGQPVIRIDIDNIYDLGQEFFRWEIATAVACAVLHVNAFDQPDVEASKLVTRELTTEYEVKGALASETPFIADADFKLFTDAANASALRDIVGSEASVADYIKAHLQRIQQGDYCALLAYINRLNPVHQDQIQVMRQIVRDKFQVATCVGYGPRFLHSTGQAYKGGPNTGVFLQITCDDAHDIPVPGHKYTFGVVKAAQARGDFEVLATRERRALRVHMGADTEAGITKLRAIVAELD